MTACVLPAAQFREEVWPKLATAIRRWVELRAGAQAQSFSTELTPAQTAASSVEVADWRDINGVLGGDGQAFARLMSRYQAPISAQMWRVSRQRSVCEELVQEVFVEAYLSLRHFKGRAPLLHWLRKIATRVTYRHWKHEAARRARPTISLDRWDGAAAADAGEVSAAEAGAEVHALLEKLPPRDRLVLTLIYLEGCSVAEAAELSGWSQALVKVQAFRARKKMKKLIEQVSS